MPRLHLAPLEAYPFRCRITVRTTDLNYGGHLGNDKVLTLAHEARVAFLAARGWTELDCAGVSLIMGDAAIVFQGEAFAGDSLDIEVAANDPGRSGFRFCYRLSKAPGGAAVALVETGMVCFDYQARRIRPLPPAVAAVCAAGPE